MTRTLVIGSAKPRTRHGRANPVTVAGDIHAPLSRRGLTYRLVVAECPFCSREHVYRDAGLRVASCGGGYLMIEAA